MKRCTRCEQFKSLEAFPRDKRARDGRASRCNACMSEILAAYKQTPAGAEARRKAQEKYQASPSGRVKRAACARSTKSRAQHRAYAHTDKGKAVMRKSREKYRRTLRKTRQGHLGLQARMAVRHATERGEIPPVSSLLCKQCRQPAVHYHHDLGYERQYWLHVLPVCQACHVCIHHPDS